MIYKIQKVNSTSVLLERKCYTDPKTFNVTFFVVVCSNGRKKSPVRLAQRSYFIFVIEYISSEVYLHYLESVEEEYVRWESGFLSQQLKNKMHMAKKRFILN